MSQFYNVKTNAGDAAIANAIATNTKLNITHVAFGDGNGAVPTPDKLRTTLVNEVHRQAVTKYTQHPTVTKWITVETIIPAATGGFWIREIGIIADGIMITHGSHAPFFKVADTEGVSEYRLKFTIDIQDASIVQLALDQSLIFATQAWVNEASILRTDIVDNLTTNYSTKPLSAAQGKVLQDNKLGKLENAASATKLQTARKINGIEFDGTSDIDLFLDVVMYSPIPYPKNIPPAGFLVMMGQAISQEIYPNLYALYGANLPDMRAYSIRGLDNGRGIDVGRVILSEQGDKIRNITGSFYSIDSNSMAGVEGAFTATTVKSGLIANGSNYHRYKASFSASNQVPTGAENTVKNVAFLYIVKAG